MTAKILYYTTTAIAHRLADERLALLRQVMQDRTPAPPPQEQTHD